MMIAYRAARIPVGGTTRRGWWVAVEDGCIAGVGPEPPAAATAVDLGDLDLLPGLVDLHSDCLEQRARPRPTTELPLEAALHDLDAELAGHGITTHLLCVSLEDDAVKHRSIERARSVAAAVAAQRSRLRVDHRLHLRVDVTGSTVEAAPEIAAGGALGLVSYMDHTPGQGQFTNVTAWRGYYAQLAEHADGDIDAELRLRLLEKQRGQGRAGETRDRVARLARDAGVALASHDDDSARTVRRAVELGATIAEFPVTLEAAQAAREAGLGILMGAPNARRGISHYGNLSARGALAEGCLDALASDYHPPSLLVAAYLIAADTGCDWAAAAALVTEGPARLAGFADRGRLAEGCRADLVAVECVGGHPVVRQTWVAGRPVLGTVAAAVPAR
jgi:alpha-D-ribose 1-methylphosphonate 5-triphosphate diphosphatase